jgi:large subunit GTPase 1
MSPKKGKKPDSGAFGNALINSKKRKARLQTGEGPHGPTRYEIADSPVPLEDRLRSKTDDFTLGDFVTEAELTGKTFTSQRGPIRILDRAQLTKEAFEALHRTPEQQAAEERLRDRLTIPRRPPWDETTTPDELHELETAEVLEWRRSLSLLEEADGVTLSPFEKNPEVWKELWRVLERSQVAVYIVDARDPLSFFCPDFVRYAEELGLPLVLALNKADLVPPPIRDAWARHFSGAPFAVEFVSTVGSEAPGVATPLALVLRARSLAREPGRDGRVTVGFVGFPNVGKSSMLNAAVGRVCARSSSTPGKTKHLQTINLEEEGITLCDCPGLVFPSFQISRAGMVANGVLSIDRMTDWRGALAVVCDRVPAEAISLLYGTEDLHGPEALAAEIARMKGFTTAHGNPDEARAAKIVLRDYVAGKLIHCELPPGISLKADADDQMEEEPPAPEAIPELPELPDAKAKKPVFTMKAKRRQVVRFTSSLE